MKKNEKKSADTKERLPTVRAGLVIIGNEILSGSIADENVCYLAKKLDDVGIIVGEVRIVGDVEEEIVRAVNDLRRKFTYVFSTGGIGPTHDDITARAMARAFNVPLHRNAEALRRLSEHYRTEDFTEARRKMADMPYGVTALIDNPVSAAPGFIMDNVYVMAGVPDIMHAMFDGVLPDLKGGAKVISKMITCHLREGVIAARLAAIDKKYDGVEIGSYPYFRAGNIGVSLVLRSSDEFQLQRAAKDIKEMILIIEKEIKESH